MRLIGGNIGDSPVKNVHDGSAFAAGGGGGRLDPSAHPALHVDNSSGTLMIAPRVGNSFDSNSDNDITATYGFYFLSTFWASHPSSGGEQSLVCTRSTAADGGTTGTREIGHRRENNASTQYTPNLSNLWFPPECTWNLGVQSFGATYIDCEKPDFCYDAFSDVSYVEVSGIAPFTAGASGTNIICATLSRGNAYGVGNIVNPSGTVVLYMFPNHHLVGGPPSFFLPATWQIQGANVQLFYVNL